MDANIKDLKMKEKESHFYEVGKEAFKNLNQDESLSLFIGGEESTFLRFNHGKVRQSTFVDQSEVTFKYHQGQKSFTLTIPFQFNKGDFERVTKALQTCRDQVQYLPEDPYLVPFEGGEPQSESFRGNIPKCGDWTKEILSSQKGIDFTGILASGPIYRGVLNSNGQKQWFSSDQFYIDYSLFTKNEKAVKGIYAGRNWNEQEFLEGLNDSAEQLKLMEKPIKSIPRGKYKVYMAPAAMGEMVSMLSWNALSYKAYKKGTSALKKLANGEAKLSKKLSLHQDFSLGLSPRFNEQGELSPKNLPIFQDGEIKNFLISSRTAKEYGVEGNGADSWEAPRTLTADPGNISHDDVLKELGNGVYLGNLHYLGWSDVQGGRITGMTRYACFWVENGEIVAPIENLRFDESLYHCWGDGLSAVTSFREVHPRTNSYGSRKLGGTYLPGIFVEDFTFTL